MAVCVFAPRLGVCVFAPRLGCLFVLFRSCAVAASVCFGPFYTLSVQHVQKVNHESLNSRYRLEALVSDRLSLAMAVKVLCLRRGT